MIRNQYIQVPHLTQDTMYGKVAKSQLDIINLTQDTTWESNNNTINITNKSQEVSPFPAGDLKVEMN